MTELDRRRQFREAVVREHMAAENDQRWDDVMATFSPGRSHYDLIASGHVFDGEVAVRKYWSDGRAVVPDQRNELIAMHHTENSVIVEFWLRGTPTGRPESERKSFEARMCAFFDFDEEGIVDERVYWDRQTIADQLE